MGQTFNRNHTPDQEDILPPFRDNPEANRFLAWCGKTALRIVGWQAKGGLPETKRFVAIGAPHTSNWDLPLALAFMLILNKRVNWMAKESLFWPPLGWLLRWLGGIPIDRNMRHNVVDYIVERFAQEDEFIIGLTPEGTRSKVEYWKTGFYYMAYRAEVPILLGYFDYRRKIIGLGPLITPSGDLEADIELFQSFYSQVTAKYPENFSEIKFRPRT